mmetsp:Transcript_8040/g.9192  ORF Transcript_8040/g.9192 Transcript_8040/m.9192 type:complete len:84 (+) Transcript_8040:137-388(+)
MSCENFFSKTVIIALVHSNTARNSISSLLLQIFYHTHKAYISPKKTNIEYSIDYSDPAHSIPPVDPLEEGNGEIWLAQLRWRS